MWLGARQKQGAVQDRQMYEQILGIEEPWFVEEVELRLEEGEDARVAGH